MTRASSDPQQAVFPRLRTAWTLYAIIALCTLVETLLILGDTGLIPLPRLRQTVYEYAGFWPGLMGPWRPNYALQPYTMFLTYALLHGGILHMAFNMITLLSLGNAVLDRIGQGRLLILLIASILGGGLFYGLMTDSSSPMVGASGGLFGLVGALLAWNYVDRFAADLELWPVLRIILALIALNLVLWWLMNGHLAWETHLGGFVTGWMAALLIDPRSQSID